MHGDGEITGFDWDAGNRDKSLKKHGVTDTEGEEAFFDPKKRILKDALHSESEERYILIGQTKQDKKLFIVFARRKDNIRIISSRPLNKKEKHLYEKS